MNTAKSVGKNPNENFEFLQTIITASIRCFYDEKAYTLFSEKGLNYFHKGVLDIVHGSAILTPVLAIFMEPEEFKTDIKSVAQSFIKQNMNCEDIKCDFAFTIGFFSEFMKDQKYIWMSKEETDNIIGNTIIFLDGIIREMTKKVFEDLR